MDSQKRPSIYVEGEDDKHALLHLLFQHQIDCDENTGPDGCPVFKPLGNREEVLIAMGVAIRTSAYANLPVAFVVDADGDFSKLWSKIERILRQEDVNVSRPLPAEGFVGLHLITGSAVGVWVMPDNERAGALEAFLRDLIDGGDLLISKAEECVGHAKEMGAEFTSRNRSKAIVRTWLAWQKDPGMPYGRAVRAHYFDSSLPLAKKFVRWFKRVYDLQ